MSLRGHALEDAFSIVNTLRYAALSRSKKQDKSWDTVKRSDVYIPPGVSPRLPAHALVHGLVRIGMPQQASSLATSMMNSGIRVRGKTLQKIVDGLAKAATVKNAASNASDARLKHHMENLLATPEILSLNSSMTSNPDTAFALELLHAARKSRSQRTGSMYNTLITLCLINGEIIVASLLFGILVKDWERRSHVLTQMTSPPTSETPEVIPSSEKLNKAYRYSLMDKELQPTPAMLKAIMAPIRKRLAGATPEDVDTPEFQEALQSLANIASFMDRRKLPFSQLSSLIHPLSHCPAVENWVWVMEHKQPVYVPANRYFHGTLLRLINSLPAKHPTKRSVVLQQSHVPCIRFRLIHPTHGMQPPLDLASYNTLIHYALRNRFSPKLAKQIYEHMTVTREPPLSGEALETFNIYLRSAALCRRRDIVSDVVQVLQPCALPEAWQHLAKTKPEFSQLPRRLKHAGRTEIHLPPAPALEQILADRYTLSTYLSSLISCGQPRFIVQLMFNLLPVLNLRRYNSPSDEERQEKWRQSLARAVALEPHILCIFLTAAIRSGTVNKVHILFKIIVEASRASLVTESEGGENGWNIPIPIYTAMFQAYEVEHERCRQRTGNPDLGRLLRKTTDLYEMVMRDVREDVKGLGKPDARFYNALLNILVKFLPARKFTMDDARNHLAQARRQYAESGFIDDRGYLPLLEKVAADMEANGYPIPIGFQHLFLNKGIRIFGDNGDIPELDRRPVAFPKSTMFGGPYSLPIYNRKSIPIRRYRYRRARTMRRTQFNR